MINAFDLVERVRVYSPQVANILLSRAIPLMIPLAHGLRVSVVEVTDTRAELFMPLRRRARNHVGSMYFGAQMTLADLAAGVLIFRRFPPGPYGALIKRVEADFLAKAKTGLRCICSVDEEASAAFEQVRTSAEGKAEAWLPLELRDTDGKLVTRVRFLGALRRFERR
jgi:acyl-coenzyme A thioesterase PaaI-like protein